MKATANIFKSLADETRLRLLLLLHGRAELCVCDLMNALDMPQSTVSRHLAYLKKNGWLHDRRGGVWMYYSLKKDLNPFFQTQLLTIIERMSGNTIYREDQHRLVVYLATKDPGSCS
jgi:ArsR family transcriptional regulator, arsenate/arsenite/antimonite-responsive transcriptional repressor